MRKNTALVSIVPRDILFPYPSNLDGDDVEVHGYMETDGTLFVSSLMYDEIKKSGRFKEFLHERN